MSEDNADCAGAYQARPGAGRHGHVLAKLSRRAKTPQRANCRMVLHSRSARARAAQAADVHVDSCRVIAHPSWARHGDCLRDEQTQALGEARDRIKAEIARARQSQQGAPPHVVTGLQRRVALLRKRLLVAEQPRSVTLAADEQGLRAADRASSYRCSSQQRSSPRKVPGRATTTPAVTPHPSPPRSRTADDGNKAVASLHVLRRQIIGDYSDACVALTARRHQFEHHLFEQIGIGCYWDAGVKRHRATDRRVHMFSLLRMRTNPSTTARERILRCYAQELVLWAVLALSSSAMSMPNSIEFGAGCKALLEAVRNLHRTVRAAQPALVRQEAAASDWLETQTTGWGSAQTAAAEASKLVEHVESSGLEEDSALLAPDIALLAASRRMKSSLVHCSTTLAVLRKQQHQAAEIAGRLRLAVDEAKGLHAAAQERLMLSQKLLQSTNPQNNVYRQVMAHLLTRMDAACSRDDKSQLDAYYYPNECINSHGPLCRLKTPTKHQCETDWVLEMLLAGAFPESHQPFTGGGRHHDNVAVQDVMVR